jgi:Nucleotidyltransferase domain
MRDAVESVCIFGSTARGEIDALSDKDVLIVAESAVRRTALRSEWTQMGWSVASYSPSRLKSVAEQGGLFIQHLKQEGLIIADPQGWLSRLLNDYSPRKNYYRDFVQSRELLRPLDRRLDGYWQRLLGTDLLYIFARNAGIYELASHGMYEFSYERIIGNLAKLKRLSEREISALLNLRRLKSAYRERKQNVDVRSGFLAGTEAIATAFGMHIEAKLEGKCWVRDLGNPYCVLRDLEARLLATFDIHQLDNFALGRRIRIYWRMITDPRGYSWSVRGIDANELAKVNRLIDLLLGRTQAYGEKREGVRIAQARDPAVDVLGVGAEPYPPRLPPWTDEAAKQTINGNG